MVANGTRSKTEQQQQSTPESITPSPTDEVRDLKQQITRLQVENSASAKENEALRGQIRQFLERFEKGQQKERNTSNSASLSSTSTLKAVGNTAQISSNDSTNTQGQTSSRNVNNG